MQVSKQASKQARSALAVALLPPSPGAPAPRNTAPLYTAPLAVRLCSRSLGVVGEAVRPRAVHLPALPGSKVAVEAMVPERVGHEERLRKARRPERPVREAHLLVRRAVPSKHAWMGVTYQLGSDTHTRPRCLSEGREAASEQGLLLGHRHVALLARIAKTVWRTRAAQYRPQTSPFS